MVLYAVLRFIVGAIGTWRLTYYDMRRALRVLQRNLIGNNKYGAHHTGTDIHHNILCLYTGTGLCYDRSTIDPKHFLDT